MLSQGPQEKSLFPKMGCQPRGRKAGWRTAGLSSKRVWTRERGLPLPRSAGASSRGFSKRRCPGGPRARRPCRHRAFCSSLACGRCAPGNAGGRAHGEGRLVAVEDTVRGKRQPPPGFMPGESPGQRSLAGHSPWGHTELHMSHVESCSHAERAVGSRAGQPTPGGFSGRAQTPL